MSENHQPEADTDETSVNSTESPTGSADQADTEQTDAERADAARAQHDHDDRIVDEWEEESFPASDPPGHY